MSAEQAAMTVWTIFTLVSAILFVPGGLLVVLITAIVCRRRDSRTRRLRVIVQAQRRMLRSGR